MRKLKRMKKLTRGMKMAVSAYGLYPDQWLVCAEGEFYIRIMNPMSGRICLIDKNARQTTRRKRK